MTEPPETVGSVSRRRVIVADDGPVLIEGPVEVMLPDGSVVNADRPMVAVCTCRRSARYPLCDTSHRRRRRRGKKRP